MISIAVRGYGIVIWDDGDWRTYTVSDAMSARLATRVELALHGLPPEEDHGNERVCAALLTIAGAHLLAVDCDHAPGECDGEAGRN